MCKMLLKIHIVFDTIIVSYICGYITHLILINDSSKRIREGRKTISYKSFYGRG